METKESKIRKEQFLAEYNKLVKKYDVQLASAPRLVPSGKGVLICLRLLSQ